MNYETLYDEFKTGTGPEKSLMYDTHPMNKDIFRSAPFRNSLRRFANSGEKKGADKPHFAPWGHPSMTMQFVGKATYNFYEVGDKLVIVVIDSKSISSESLNFFNKDESRNIKRTYGKTIPRSNTHQTYLWIIPAEIKSVY